MTPTTKLQNFYNELSKQSKLKSTKVDGTISLELACEGKGLKMGYYFTRLTSNENLEVAYFHNKTARIIIVGNSTDLIFDYSVKDPKTKEYTMTQISPIDLTNKLPEIYKMLTHKK